MCGGFGSCSGIYLAGSDEGGDLLEGKFGFLGVVKWFGVGSKDLSLFVAFSGQNENIPLLHHRSSFANRFAATSDFDYRARSAI